MADPKNLVDFIWERAVLTGPKPPLKVITRDSSSFCPFHFPTQCEECRQYRLGNACCFSHAVLIITISVLAPLRKQSGNDEGCVCGNLHQYCQLSTGTQGSVLIAAGSPLYRLIGC